LAVERSSLGSLEIRLQARPEFVSVLRQRVRVWLDEAQASEREVFEVLLATTEAFANAVEHPHQPTSHFLDVEGALTDGCVTISIRDYGTWQRKAVRKEGGLGLVMIEALMDTVQVERALHGTTVTMRRRLQMH
jgi:anti-sigma regulatory factor (Ser/Thr protein kinase)